MLISKRGQGCWADGSHKSPTVSEQAEFLLLDLQSEVGGGRAKGHVTRKVCHNQAIKVT